MNQIFASGQNSNMSIDTTNFLMDIKYDNFHQWFMSIQIYTTHSIGIRDLYFSYKSYSLKRFDEKFFTTPYHDNTNKYKSIYRLIIDTTCMYSMYLEIIKWYSLNKHPSLITSHKISLSNLKYKFQQFWIC